MVGGEEGRSSGEGAGAGVGEGKIMDILVRRCSRHILNGVYHSDTAAAFPASADDVAAAGRTWTQHPDPQQPDVAPASLVARDVDGSGVAAWVFSDASGRPALRSADPAASAPPHEQKVWEAYVFDAGVWVSADADLQAVPRRLTLASGKPRVNGGYTLVGAHAGMPQYACGRCRLYWSTCWIVAESEAHVSRAKGVLKTRATEELPFDPTSSLEWLASNTAQRRWEEAFVSIDPLPEDGAETAASPQAGRATSPTRRVGATGQSAMAVVWEDSHKRSEEIMHLERSLQNLVRKKAPKRLAVRTPVPAEGALVSEREDSILRMVPGTYYLKEGKLENGFPVWERGGGPGSKYGRLFSSVTGRWVFTLSNREFIGRETGLIQSAPVHYGRLPDDEELEEEWEFVQEGSGGGGGGSRLHLVVEAVGAGFGSGEYGGYEDLDGDVQPPPTPSQYSVVPTELDCDDALQVSDSNISDNALLLRLYVFLERLNSVAEVERAGGGGGGGGGGTATSPSPTSSAPCKSVSQFLPAKLTTRQLLLDVRSGKTTVDYLFFQLCADANAGKADGARTRLNHSDWQGLQCRACVDYVLRKLMLRAGDVQGLECLPLVVEGVVTKKIHVVQYVQQLCIRYNGTASERIFDADDWSADFPRAVMPADFHTVFFAHEAASQHNTAAAAAAATSSSPSRLHAPGPGLSLSREDALKLYMQRELGMSHAEIAGSKRSLLLPPPAEAATPTETGDAESSGAGDAAEQQPLHRMRELRRHHESVAREKKEELSLLREKFGAATHDGQMDYVEFQHLQNEELQKQIQSLAQQQEAFQRATLDALGAAMRPPGATVAAAATASPHHYDHLAAVSSPPAAHHLDLLNLAPPLASPPPAVDYAAARYAATGVAAAAPHQPYGGGGLSAAQYRGWAESGLPVHPSSAHSPSATLPPSSPVAYESRYDLDAVARVPPPPQQQASAAAAAIAAAQQQQQQQLARNRAVSPPYPSSVAAGY